MKKFIIMAMAVTLSGVTAFAQSLPDGFYRIQNKGSQRYIYVRDCTGQASTVGTDLGSIETWPDLNAAVSDPGTVVYSKYTNGLYDLSTQGTSVNKVIGTNIKVYVDGDICQVYAEGQYLYELGTSDEGYGILGAKTSSEAKVGIEFRQWLTPAISSSTSNFFGFKPTVTAGGKYYAPFFADFAYAPNAAVKTWYVSQIDKANAIAVIKEITGTVAKQQPVFIECVGAEPSSNKVDLIAAGGNTASGNKMSGVFFDNGERSNKDHTGISPACVVFDANTMRMLGTDAEGNLAFINNPANLTSTIAFINKSWVSNTKVIPHNQSYISVDADCPATLKVMTTSEYEAFIADGIDNIVDDASSNATIYDLNGRVANSKKNGIYIKNNKKFILK